MFCGRVLNVFFRFPTFPFFEISTDFSIFFQLKMILTIGDILGCIMFCTIFHIVIWILNHCYLSLLMTRPQFVPNQHMNLNQQWQALNDYSAQNILDSYTLEDRSSRAFISIFKWTFGVFLLLLWILICANLRISHYRFLFGALAVIVCYITFLYWKSRLVVRSFITTYGTTLFLILFFGSALINPIITIFVVVFIGCPYGIYCNCHELSIK